MKSTKRIAVLGGGAAGLAVLKVLLELPQVRDKSWHVVCYEAREDIGGVWLPAPPTDDPPLTPLYDSLTTNLPHPIMAYQSLPFPSSTLLFPPASAVLAYLRSYATTFGLLPFIRLGRRVEDMRWDAEERCWELKVAPGGQGEARKHYDAVIVCNGHYSLPHYPSTLGFDAWRTQGKVTITHSAFYRNPEPWKDKIVLVMGGGPSGSDVSAEAASVAKKVYHSVSGFVSEDVGNVSRRPRAKEFRQDGSVLFEDGSVAQDIDSVIPATGYQYDYPFISPPLLVHSTLPLGPGPTPPQHVGNDTNHVYALARHLWPLQQDFPTHTLAFIGLPARVIPFPIFEVQARCVVRVLLHPSALDIPHELELVRARDVELREQCAGNQREVSKSWHRLPDEEQFAYREELLAFARLRKGEWAVEDWAREMYPVKGELRKEWREIERRGEGKRWVHGVGEGGVSEWIDLMRRVLKEARRREARGQNINGLEKVEDLGKV
ncbi:FAD/NADP-binding domain-containing protein [Dacryopinax primogenitus]|uniref:FAD/NADP-binding domain-containing protein n=1 Tax=Dacryopinax primogenitus (strain DJM 731) TaxID=1858805 RepID=M5FU13_DACPD|nr:FAD/NADP-binding domain-containing protein [Dacryopinax primogenitus]EJT99658.1 FAD/NADP-binding domain-containing protein [Dacryopinax primogenitus]